MPTYSYSAIDSEGVRHAGEIEASDPDAVVSQLTAKGMRVEGVQMVFPAAPARVERTPAPRMSTAQAQEIGGHLAEVVAAGLPLEAGLAAVAEEFPWGRMGRALRRIAGRMETGESLDSALSASGAPAYFPALVRAGRRSGRTADILENFIASSRSVSDLRQSLWMALAYPLALLVLSIPLGLFLFLWLIPGFETIFADFGIQLPLITEFVLNVSKFLGDHGLATLGILAGAVLAVGVVLRLALGAAGWRRLVCTIPVVGPLMRWLGLARFSPILSLLIESRVPLDEALVLAGEASGDAEIREDSGELAAHLRSGRSLESAARDIGRFPKSFVRALAWERQREGFAEVLQSMSEMYAGRARALVAILIAVLPPVVVTLVAFIVGFIVIALFMPLIELLNKLS
jgi:general secretion pathway protein F